MKSYFPRILILFSGVLLMATLIACGATAADEEPAAEGAAETPVSALEPVTEEPTVDETNAEENNGEPVEPVEVDLSEITPESADPNAAPQEMPAPGRPGPSQAMMDAIMEDLAERRGVSLENLSVEVESIEGREWRDSSLGCPAEGMMYMQVITPGYLVELRSDGQLYEYHTDQREAFVLCVNGKPAE